MWKRGKQALEKQRVPNSIERCGELIFFLSNLWPFDVFVMLKTLFSKDWFIKILLTCLYMNTEVKKILQQQWLQLQMKLLLGDYMKFAIWWGRNNAFERGGCILLGECLAVGWDSLNILNFPQKLKEMETVRTWWEQKSNIKGEFLIRRKIQRLKFWEVILMDTFFIKRFSSNKLFLIRKIFDKIFNRRAKVKLLDLQGELSLPQFLLLMEHLDFLIRKSLRMVLSMLTVMILKQVSETIFFQSNKSTVCKVKDGKQVANSLMVFNFLMIIHLFQDKKHLRT